jgi:hypothetical protein
VRIDEPRHADHAAAVDRGRAGRGERLRHRHDRAIAHVDVAALEVTELRVHGEHGGAADHELAARRQRLHGRARTRRLRERASRDDSCRCESHSSLERRAAIHHGCMHISPVPEKF